MKGKIEIIGDLELYLVVGYKKFYRRKKDDPPDILQGPKGDKGDKGEDGTKWFHGDKIT